MYSVRQRPASPIQLPLAEAYSSWKVRSQYVASLRSPSHPARAPTKLPHSVSLVPYTASASGEPRCGVATVITVFVLRATVA